jgi:hypothetical protein
MSPDHFIDAGSADVTFLHASEVIHDNAHLFLPLSG